MSLTKNNPVYYTVPEAAELLGVSNVTIYTMLKAKQIQGKQLGGKYGRYFILKEPFNQFVKEMRGDVEVKKDIVKGEK